VKLPIETKSLEELQHELEIMARVQLRNWAPEISIDLLRAIQMMYLYQIGHHPNIIQLHGFIDDGEKIAIVIEVAIMSLLQYAKKFASDQTSSIDPSYSLFHSEIPPYRAYSILRQIASAMVGS
jgi:serine/threonine protein kinase